MSHNSEQTDFHNGQDDIPGSEELKNSEQAGDNAGRDEEKVRCHDVLLKYNKTDGVLAGRQLRKALEHLQRKRSDKMGSLDKIADKLLHRDEWQNPMPVREVWKRGMSFLSKNYLENGQHLVLMMTFAAHTRFSTTIYAQAKVEDCGTGKGRYPYKVEVVFTQLDGKAMEVIKNPAQFLPRG